MLYELDKREEWTDPTAWIKANPGLGTIKQYTTLADFVERAKKNPEDLPGVLCKDFNVKATGAASWLSYEDAVNEATFKPEEVYNTYAIGGCDLSATTDLTCATLIIRRSSDDEIVYVFQHYFLPQKKIDQLDEHNTQEAPYKIWAERGLVTICEGTRVDYSAVTAWYCQMRDELKIDAFKIGYDRALAGYWVDEMKANGFEMCAVAQGPFTWSQPMRELGAALADKKVNYNKNPVLLWCLTNTGVKKKRREQHSARQDFRKAPYRRHGIPPQCVGYLCAGLRGLYVFSGVKKWQREGSFNLFSGARARKIKISTHTSS